MTDNFDDIPIAEMYRDVGLHDRQSPERIGVVKAEIDAVFEMTDPSQLQRFAEDIGNAPESRLLAAALCQAEFNQAAIDRKSRPDIDIDRVCAAVAGLDSRTWRSPWVYCSLLDTSVGSQEPVAREKMLTDEDCGG